MATNPNAGPSVPLATRVKNILLTPKTEWPVIDAEPSTIGGIYRSYVIILAAIPAIASAIGLLLMGGNYGLISIRLPVEYIVANAVVGYLFALAGVYIMALIIEALAPTFGGVKNRVSAFKVAAYSATVSWVAGIVLVFPALGILVLLAAIYGLYLIYLGLPVLMKSPADKSVGYVAAVIVAAIVLYLVIGAVTAAILGNLMPVPGPGSVQINVPG